MKVYVDDIFEEEEKNGYHEFTEEVLKECKNKSFDLSDYLYSYTLSIDWDAARNCPRLYLVKFEVNY